jgi:hypothetical protein
MKPEAAERYARELASYERHRAELERQHRGQIALLRGDQLVGVFPTLEKALAMVIESFGRPEQCLWQEVGQPIHLKPMWGLPEEGAPISEEEPAEVYFAQELAAYERLRDDLERNHRGEFALLCGDALIGVFRDEDAALAEGRRRFGLDKFMLREIGDAVHSFPLCELPRKREP